MLPEEFNLYERLTGAELLDFTAAMHGLDREEALKRRNELLDMLDLVSAGSKVIGDYSRGMLRKCAAPGNRLALPRRSYRRGE